MVSAVVLLTVERATINQVAETLAGMEGVSEVYSVGGRYDLVAIIRVKDNEGGGARFIIELPVRQGSTRTGPRPARSEG